MIELSAYATDCRVYGTVDLGEGRMSDKLNATRELQIGSARLVSVADNHEVELAEIVVGREELCAVVASGTQGDPARRLRTRTTRVEVEVGPYHVEGALHGTAASDPLAPALRRAAWVPLTDATVTYRPGGRVVRERIATLIVNRDLATLFRELEDLGGIQTGETAGAAAGPPSAHGHVVDPSDTLEGWDRPDPAASAAFTAPEPAV